MIPAPLRDTPGIELAMAFARDAYGTRLRRGRRTVEHSIAVAELLADADAPPTVVIAGLLHDVLEDADVAAEEVQDRFGREVARIVRALTQDPAIEDYAERKAALRRQTITAGRAAATIALADKVAKLKVSPDPPKKRKLRHYAATLQAVEDQYGRSPLSEHLREQLDRWPVR
jgi:(p)ppGpp synthase/HD superfamily hydrolase